METHRQTQHGPGCGKIYRNRIRLVSNDYNRLTYLAGARTAVTTVVACGIDGASWTSKKKESKNRRMMSGHVTRFGIAQASERAQLIQHTPIEKQTRLRV